MIEDSSIERANALRDRIWNLITDEFGDLTAMSTIGVLHLVQHEIVEGLPKIDTIWVLDSPVK